MKTRFLQALTYELSGPDFPAGKSRLRPLCLRQTADSQHENPRAHSTLTTPSTGEHPHEHPDSWRFASAWRGKPADNFLPPAGTKRFFPAFILGIASLGMALVAGCQSNGYIAPGTHYSEPVESSLPKAAELQMISVTNRLDPALLNAPTNLFTLGPGDKLDIELPDETNSLTTTVVGPDGKIYFNLLPGTDVWGLTLGQTREVLEHELSKYVRGQPLVNVTLKDVESKHVWLLGRFQQPGIYNMATPTTLLEAIAAAGGSQSFAGQRQISQGGPLGADLADLRHSFIVRNNKMLPVDFERLLDKGDLSQNIYLQPDDFVYFAPAYAKEVYVLGAVSLPQPVQYVNGMTLMQAIAGCYGTVRDAWLGHVTIVRGSLAKPEVAFVNYYDIVKGHAPDIALQPNDIIYVPLTRYRYLRKYLDIALDTFVSSVAINEGTKISEPKATVSGITIPAGSGITIVPSPVPPVGGGH